MFDFIELATSSRQLIERALAEDDDFAKLDGNDGSGATNSGAFAGVDFPGAGAVAYAAESTPILSKTAEAELYLLATNFLLCT